MLGITSFPVDYAISVLTAALLLPVVALVVTLPGLLPALAFRRAFRAPSAALFPIAAGVSVSILSATAEIAYFAHWGLVAAFVGFGAVSAVISAFLWRNHDWRDIGWEPAEWRRDAWVLAAGFGVLSLIQGAWLTGDAPYHLAATRSLLVFNRPLVTDPYYGIRNAPVDAISGSWHTMMALASRVTGLDILTLWPSLTAFGAIMLVLGFWTLANEAAGSRRVASLATVAMVGTLYWTDFRAFAYPGFFSRGLLFIAIWAMVRSLDEPSWMAALAVAALGSAVAAVHLGSGEMYFLAAAAILVAGAVGVARAGWGNPRPRAAWVRLTAGVVGAAAIVAPITIARSATIAGLDIAPPGFELWRRYLQALPGLYFRRPQWFWGHPGLWVASNVPALVLGALGIAILAFMTRDAWRCATGRSWAVLGVVALPVVLAAPPLSVLVSARSPYMLVRLLDVLDSLAFVGFAWALARNERVLRVSTKGIAITAIALSLLCAAPGLIEVYSFRKPPWGSTNPGVIATLRHDRRLYWGPTAMRQLGQVVDSRYPLVASDVSTGYEMLAYMPISIVAGHPVHSPYYVELTDGARRRADMARLLAPQTPEPERLALVRHWGVDLIIVSPTKRSYHDIVSALQHDPAAFKEVLSSSRLWAFEPTSR